MSKWQRWSGIFGLAYVALQIATFRSLGRLRCGGLNLIGAGSLFGGNNPTGFYSANGFAGVLGLFPFLIWVACVSGAMIAMRAPRPVAPAVPVS